MKFTDRPKNRHDHHHHHHHHHHHSHIGHLANVPDIDKQLRLIVCCLVINLVFVVVEASLGYASNSAGLISDAGHNLSDVLGLFLALLGLVLARSGKAKSSRISGYVGGVNALLLVIAVAIIGVESLGKIINPTSVDAGVVMFTAGVGIVVNGVTAWLLMRGQGSDVNVRAAYLHAASDALVSVGVVLSGLVVMLTGWDIVDGIVSLVITLMVGVPAVKLLVDAVKEIAIFEER